MGREACLFISCNPPPCGCGKMPGGGKKLPGSCDPLLCGCGKLPGGGMKLPGGCKKLPGGCKKLLGSCGPLPDGCGKLPEGCTKLSGSWGPPIGGFGKLPRGSGKLPGGCESRLPRCAGSGMSNGMGDFPIPSLDQSRCSVSSLFCTYVYCYSLLPSNPPTHTLHFCRGGRA